MAQVINAGANQIRTNDGKTITANQGGWYDGQQYWGGTLSSAGQINSQSNQQGAGQQVSNQVVAQTNPNNVAYIQQQQQQQQPQPQQPQDPNAGGGAYPTGGGSAGGTQGIPALTPQPVLDLPALYESLYKTSGITDSQKEYDAATAELNDKQAAHDAALATINDNPFYSEGTRVGRVNKLNDIHNNDVALIQNKQKAAMDKIATQKADIQTKLDIQTKQFDINSQQAKQSLDQFNSLLASGALDNASGEDIANLTRATGLSSNMIQSAIKSSQDKNTPTSTISFDDGTNQGFAVINTKTGAIISKTTVAGSKIAATADAKIQEKAAPGSSTTKTSATQTASQNKQNDIANAQYAIELYKNTNPSNPSFNQAHALRQSYSPADFKKSLLIEFPNAASYINSALK